MSLFFVDSSCDLDAQLIKNLGIECFSLPFKIEGEVKSITDDFDYLKFYSKVRKGVDLSYEALSEKGYIKIFEPALQGGDDIVYVHASSKIFDTKNLVSAREKLLNKYPERKIELIDSKNFSVGYGAVCFKLALEYRNGKTIQEIVDNAYETIDSMACYMVVDSLEPVNNFGAMDCGAVVGTALNIKSILAIDIDGNFRLLEKVSGKKRAVSKLVQLIRQTGKNIADNPLYVCNSHSASDADSLIGTLKEYMGDDFKAVSENLTPSNTIVVGNGVVLVSFPVHKKIH